MKEKVNFKENFLTYVKFVGKYKWLYLVLAIIVVVTETLRTTERYLFKLVIDNGTLFSNNEQSLSVLTQILLGILIAYVCVLLTKLVFHWFQMHLINRLDSSVILDLKNKFFTHIVSLSHNFHTTHKTGSMISKLTRGSRAIEKMTDFIFFNLAPVVFQIIIVSVWFTYFDVTSAIIVCAVAVLFIAYGIALNIIQQKVNLEANAAEDIEKANIGDVFANIDSIKYFGKEDYINKRFNTLAGRTKSLFLKLWDYGRWSDAGQGFILGLGTFFLFFFSIKKFLAGEMTIGTIGFIYTAYLSIQSPLYGFTHSIRGFYQAMADFQGLFAYAKIENEVKDLKNAQKLEIKEGQVEFRNIKFGYNKRIVIDGIDLVVKPGEKIALVGHSGSGKTTLIKLLYRFYDVVSGKILIDGKDIKDFKQESLRSELSIVPQECILFDDTIYNNIAFSRPDAKRNEVMAAIKFAQLDNFVKNLPNKESTIVGERGVKLSGGEKQRVSIARALLADRKVLVLDEATSSLDSKTEHEIQKDLHNLMKGRTSIIIAHRLSTIMSADRIIVMNKGKIAQIGNHKELIGKKGIYRELWNLQKGGYIE